jgi:hypothetical protein
VPAPRKPVGGRSAVSWARAAGGVSFVSLTGCRPIGSPAAERRPSWPSAGRTAAHLDGLALRDRADQRTGRTFAVPAARSAARAVSAAETTVQMMPRPSPQSGVSCVDLVNIYSGCSMIHTGIEIC